MSLTLSNAAGMSMDTVIGTETSVYVGAFTSDYSNMLNTDPEMLLKYAPTGNSSSILSNRVSWFYDLKGCSLTVDTACSSSLVAFHLACQNLKENGAKMVIIPPPLSEFKTNSQQGNCQWN